MTDARLREECGVCVSGQVKRDMCGYADHRSHTSACHLSFETDLCSGLTGQTTPRSEEVTRVERDQLDWSSVSVS